MSATPNPDPTGPRDATDSTRRHAAHWRLFTAVLCDPAAVDDLHRRITRTRREFAGEPGVEAIRWVDPALWHLTMLFLGWTDPDLVASISTACSRAAKSCPPLTWQLQGAGRFPSGGAARVLWTGVREEQERSLQRLFRATRREVRAVRVRVERRPYHPHLTLARVRRSAGRAEPPTATVLGALQDYVGPGQHARELVLIRSHPGPRPRYERLAGFPLGSSVANRSPQ